MKPNSLPSLIVKFKMEIPFDFGGMGEKRLCVCINCCFFDTEG